MRLLKKSLNWVVLCVEEGCGARIKASQSTEAALAGNGANAGQE